MGSQGSGAVIATNSIGVFILTAEHVCRKMDKKIVQIFGNILIPQKIRKKKKIRIKKKMHVHTFMGDKSIADIVAMDEELDVASCLLRGFQLSLSNDIMESWTSAKNTTILLPLLAQQRPNLFLFWKDVF